MAPLLVDSELSVITISSVLAFANAAAALASWSLPETTGVTLDAARAHAGGAGGAGSGR